MWSRTDVMGDIIVVVVMDHTTVRQQRKRTLQIDLNTFILVQFVARHTEHTGVDEEGEGPRQPREYRTLPVRTAVCRVVCTVQRGGRLHERLQVEFARELFVDVRYAGSGFHSVFTTFRVRGGRRVVTTRRR